METRKLRHAVALGRLLNFTRAAEQLNLTQSALSRSIQSLEAECGLKLFDRGRGGVALTQAGREFVGHAERLLRNEAALRNFANHASQGEGGHITLGVTPLAARVLLAPVLSKRLSEPQFQAEVIVHSTKQLMQMVLHETIDLGIGMGDLPLDNSALTAVKLARLSMAMIVRSDHPLTRLKEVRQEDMERYPIIRPTLYSSDDILPATAGPVRSDPPAVTVEDYDVLDQIVRMSDAIWVTSPIAAKHGIANAELTQLPMPWLPETSVSLVAYSLSQRTLSPLANSMLAQFITVGSQVSALS